MEQLPVVTFGKYKGRPVTELMADTSYLEWCKKQDFFKDKKEYNIIVNQFISTTTDSKTPEHNKLQNLFLDSDFQYIFLNKLSSFRLQHELLVKLYESEEYIKYFGNQRFKEKIKIEPVFETEYNWDIKLTIEDDYTDKINVNEEFCIEDRVKNEKDAEIIVKMCKESNMSYSEGRRILSSQVCRDVGLYFDYPYIYIEVKPLLGDDYPCVLRKMTNQIKLTNAKCNYNKFILFVKEYKSNITTKEQLIDIFKMSNILIIFHIEETTEEKIRLIDEQILKLQQERENLFLQIT
jgi:hypothetical protein